MLCKKCGKRIRFDDKSVSQEGNRCPYCGAPVVSSRPHDPDSAVVPDREQIDEKDTEPK